MSMNEHPEILSALDLADYVVCPEAWRLKRFTSGSRLENARQVESQEIRAEWARKQDLSSLLKGCARIVYALLVLLTLIAFILESNRSHYIRSLLKVAPKDDSSFTVPGEILLLLLLLGLIIFLWDFFERKNKQLRETSGMNEKAEALAVKGSSQTPGSILNSTRLGLKSKPDAVLREKGQIVPVDIHPLANKIRDRHVVQMLVHLRLLEESEGKRPEHGVLLMGKTQRRVLLRNTPEKQRWLETLIDEMRSIMEGVPAMPSPSPPKCRACDVRESCRFSQAKVTERSERFPEKLKVYS